MFCALFPAGESEFAGQDRQALDAVAPSLPEYVCCGQFTQSAGPVSALYLPGVQRVHVSPFGPVEPALQVQVSMKVVPTGEPERGGHGWQESVRSFEYVSTGHDRHDSSPMLRLFAEYFPPGHFEHTYRSLRSS